MTAGKHMGMVKRTVVGSRMLIKKPGFRIMVYYCIITFAWLASMMWALQCVCLFPNCTCTPSYPIRLAYVQVAHEWSYLSHACLDNSCIIRVLCSCLCCWVCLLSDTHFCFCLACMGRGRGGRAVCACNMQLGTLQALPPHACCAVSVRYNYCFKIGCWQAGNSSSLLRSWLPKKWLYPA